MAYDICDDDTTLDLIESEMANQGITQQDIDEERGSAERQMLDDMKLVHQNGAPLDYRDHNGATPLHVAACNGYYDVAAFLLRCRVPATVRDNDLWQPIHAAACWAQPDIIELLCEYGADVNAKTSANETALDLCDDMQTRAVIVTLQQEAAKKRRLAFGARDSRRQSRKKRAHSKFESIEPQTSPLSGDISSARGAIRRQSLRDKSGGMTLGRMEAKREGEMLRSWSQEDLSRKQPLSTEKKKSNLKGSSVGTEQIGLRLDGDKKALSSSERWPAAGDEASEGEEEEPLKKKKDRMRDSRRKPKKKRNEEEAGGGNEDDDSGGGEQKQRSNGSTSFEADGESGQGQQDAKKRGQSSAGEDGGSNGLRPRRAASKSRRCVRCCVIQ